ncbi:MAG: HEAT repeat domain-containing protein [Phycisphaerae bacterium]
MLACLRRPRATPACARSGRADRAATVGGIAADTIRRPALTGPAPLALILALGAICATPAAHADVFHLSHGGTVSGELIETTATSHVVRTVVGTIDLPRDAVVRIEPAPSPFAEYDRRRVAAPPTADANYELAEWCGQNELMAERRRHLLAAIALDPDHAASRAALGYVRVGALWIDGRASFDPKRAERPAETRPADADRENERVAAAIQINWSVRVRAIRNTMLESGSERYQRSGRLQILEIRDPLAILPLVRVLSEGARLSRLVLVESLSGFSEDEATLNLAVLAMVDADEDVRHAALTQILRRNDPRVAPQIRKALRSSSDELVRRAALGLATLRDSAAVPDLIDALRARRWRWVDVPLGRYFGELPTIFARPTRAVIGPGSNVFHTPQIGMLDAAGVFAAQSRQQLRKVTVFRTEVLEALRALTGEDFGFDQAAWRRWYEEHKP